MRIVRKALAVTVVTLAGAMPARAQMGMIGMLGRSSPGVSVDAPVGDLAKIAGTGFGVALRTTFGAGDRDEWSGRGLFGFDRFPGKGALLNAQYFSYGLEIVHRSETWYQFGGFAIYNGRFNYDENSLVLTTDRRSSFGDFGLSGGVGVNFGDERKAHTFLEFGATNVFTNRSSDVWFPVRFGLKF